VSYVVRAETPPDDSVIVVRGGLASFDSMRRTAEVSQILHGFFGVSVFLAFDLSLEELVRRTSELAPERYKQLRTTTVGAVKQAGFELLATGEWPHYDIVLADLSDATVERLRDCFGPPFANPAGGARLAEP